MGAIGSKRGSVRGAPPEVYAPFIIPGDSEECDEELEATAVDTLVFICLGIILYGAVIVWRGIRSIF